jgi:hypothetical protein
MSPRDSSAAALQAPEDEDPVERAFRLAPVVHEKITDEERAAMVDGTSKPRIPHAPVMAEFGVRRR